MFWQGPIEHCSPEAGGRSLTYVIFKVSPGETRITGGVVWPLKEKASRPAPSRTACRVNDTTPLCATIWGASARVTVLCWNKIIRITVASENNPRRRSDDRIFIGLLQ